MNVADSERMAGALEAVGYQCSTDAGAADVIIFNTCSIREKAENKVYSALGPQAKRKREHMKDVKIVVAGCVAQQEGQQLLRRVPELDIVMGEARRGARCAACGHRIAWAHDDGDAYHAGRHSVSECKLHGRPANCDECPRVKSRGLHGKRVHHCRVRCAGPQFANKIAELLERSSDAQVSATHSAVPLLQYG